MKVLMIDVVCGVQSTGRICTDLAQILEKQGDECKVAYGRNNVPAKFQKYAIKIGSKLDVYSHAFFARIFDCTGFGSILATKRLIKKIQQYDPDIIHLHDLHGYHINVELLFKYLKKRNKPVVWSFYDCWAFTGHCAHFDYNGCDKWKKGCHNCAYKKDYPASLIFNRAKDNYKKKKALFTGVEKMHLIAPSKWMAEMVSQSFMKNYPMHILPNGIDLSAFEENNMVTKKDLGIENKFVLLGVSSVWQKMKGLDDILRLAETLPREDYAIVLVGQMPGNVRLPENVIHVSKTDSITQLCSYYSMADVFINPTLQETQGLTTVEALACGTPAVLYRSGGAAECVDHTCGIVVPRGDVAGMRAAVEDIKEGTQKFTKENCKAAAQKYSKDELYKPFIELYQSLTEAEE